VTSQIDRRNKEGYIRLKQSEFWNEVGRKWNRRRRKDFERTEAGRSKQTNTRGSAGGEEECVERRGRIEG
jgi:hypothetical protein